MNQTDKEKLFKSAELMQCIGMSIFYVAAMFAFFLAGSMAGNAIDTGEFNTFVYIAYVVLSISVIAVPFLAVAVVKYSKYRKLLNEDA